LRGGTSLSAIAAIRFSGATGRAIGVGDPQTPSTVKRCGLSGVVVVPEIVMDGLEGPHQAGSRGPNVHEVAGNAGRRLAGGIKWWRDHLFVSDNMGMVWRIDAAGA
jgi:hypothetical protein